MKYALGHETGIDVEEIPVPKGASIVEMLIRYYDAFYYPLDKRQIWEFVLVSRQTLQMMIGSYFIKLVFFFYCG